MGNDFSNHQISTGNNPDQVRSRILKELPAYMKASGYRACSKDEAYRSIVVGPAEKWITVLDSAGNGDDANIEAFVKLANHFSQYGPVVTVEMDDSAAFHLTLYEKEICIDRFANRKSVIEVWESEEEADIYRGQPEVWARALGQESHKASLAIVWSLTDANEILAETGRVLGWNADLCEVGYIIDYDGIPVVYSTHLNDEAIDLSAVSETHWV